VILSDGEIREALDHGHLVIDPLEKKQIQPSSVDLRLGKTVTAFRAPTIMEQVDGRRFDPHADSAGDLMQSFDLKLAPMALKPGDFFLAHTMERVVIPTDLVGVVDGRSSMGRLGIMVHITAGYIDPGFRGQITLEMHNVGPLTVLLRPGDRICQIRFHRMARAAEHPYAGKYQGDKGAVSSRLNDDFKGVAGDGVEEAEAGEHRSRE
jgi:dCTP deaminase